MRHFLLILKQCVKGATLKKREDSCEKSGSKGIIIRSGMLLKVWKVVSVVNKRATSPLLLLLSKDAIRLKKSFRVAATEIIWIFHEQLALSKDKNN